MKNGMTNLAARLAIAIVSHIVHNSYCINVKSINGEYNISIRTGFFPYTQHASQWEEVDCEVEIGHIVGLREGRTENLGNYQLAD